jgi:hypothetical protein
VEEEASVEAAMEEGVDVGVNDKTKTRTEPLDA